MSDDDMDLFTYLRRLRHIKPSFQFRFYRCVTELRPDVHQELVVRIKTLKSNKNIK